MVIFFFWKKWWYDSLIQEVFGFLLNACHKSYVRKNNGLVLKYAESRNFSSSSFVAK